MADKLIRSQLNGVRSCGEENILELCLKQDKKHPLWSLPLKIIVEIFQYPFDSEEDPNGQDVSCDAKQPSEGGPDAHHGEEIHRGRRRSHQVQGAGDIHHLQVMVTHITCKLELDIINLFKG